MQHPRPTPSPRSLGDLAALTGLMVVGDPTTVVTGITHDSRAIVPGDIFAALPGEHTDGTQFIAQARAAGAVAVLCDPATVQSGATGDLPALTADNPRAVLGRLSAQVYGDAANHMTVIGVTGTNGKSTSVHLLAAGLVAAGHTVGVIGTTGVFIDNDTLPSARTTPEATDLHALLAVMRERGISAVAMEVSSHALVLGRVDGLVFDVALFTQLTQDHLDFHGTMEDYFAAKASLFTAERARRAVIGVDGMWGRRLADQVQIPALTYALDHDADVQCVAITDLARGQSLQVHSDGAVHRVDVGLPGRFNAANALGAWTTLRLMGIDADVLSSSMANVCVPGRMEAITAGQSFTVIVDYAHSPDAVARVLDAVTPASGGRRIVVLGCGGDRDRDKRRLMGEIAAHGCDLLIVTDDNPRSEDPAVIRAAMLEGAQQGSGPRGEIREIGDRRDAIAGAIAEARPGDVVLVLGKGHEQGQDISGVIHPFDDREELRRALAGAS
mgnify:CR=1 FL=1